MLLFSSWLDLGAVVVWRLSHCFALSSVCSVLVGSVLVRLGKLDGWRWPEMAGEVHGADMVHDDVVVAWTSWHTLTYQSSLMSPVFALRWSQYLLTSVFHIGIVIKSFSVFSFIVLNVWQTESSLFFVKNGDSFLIAVWSCRKCHVPLLLFSIIHIDVRKERAVSQFRDGPHVSPCDFPSGICSR